MKPNFQRIEDNLMLIFNELTAQPSMATYFSPEGLSYDGHMERIREYVELAGEYGLAYELIICVLEDVPFTLSARAAIKLLEVGLVMGFKTEREEDALFDRRIIGQRG